MQPGISTYTFPWAFGVPGYPPDKPMTLFDLLQKAQDFDLKVVQIGDNVPLHLLPAEERADFFAEAKKQNIHLEIGTRRLTFENVKTYLEIAKAADSKFLRMVIDDADYRPGVEEVLATIQHLLPLLKELNIILAIENHDRFPALTLQKIIQATSEEYVGICLDTANSLGAGEGIREIVSVLKNYTVNLHIKDYHIQRLPHKMGFLVEGRPAGEGMLPLEWLLKEFSNQKSCETATLEVWSSPLGKLEETIDQEKRWVEKSMVKLSESEFLEL